MVNDTPDAQYELLWETQQDDLYILHEGEEQSMPKRVESIRNPANSNPLPPLVAPLVCICMTPMPTVSRPPALSQ